MFRWLSSFWSSRPETKQKSDCLSTQPLDVTPACRTPPKPGDVQDAHVFDSNQPAKTAESVSQTTGPEPSNLLAETSDQSLPESITIRTEQLAEVKEALAQLLSSQSKVSSARSRCIELRDQSRYERRNFRDKINYVFESQKKLIGLIPNHLFVDQPDLEALKKQLEDDHTSLETADGTLQNAEYDLSEAEARMLDQEADTSRLTANFKEVLRSLELPGMTVFESTVTPPELRSSPLFPPVSPQLHPTLADFYEKAGHEYVLRERLSELSQEHEAARVHRNFREDHEELVEPPNAVFEAKYQAKYAEAAGQLKLAIESAAAAKEACLSDGLIVDDFLGLLPAEDSTKERVEDWIEHSEGGPPTPEHISSLRASVEPVILDTSNIIRNHSRPLVRARSVSSPA